MKNISAITAILCTTLLIQGCRSANGNNTRTGKPAAAQYACIPCGSGCDTLLYEKPGTCTHCSMQLVDKQTIRHNQVNPGQLCGLIAAKGAANVLLLDVRSPEEYNGTAPEKFGRLKNAVNIPVQQLQQRINELKAYKNHEIIVYCSHSHRSPRASYMLTQNGFNKVTNLAGGMSLWQQRAASDSCSSAIYIAQ